MGEVIHNDWLVETRTIRKRGMEDKEIYLNTWFILSLAIKGALEGKLDSLTIFVFQMDELKITFGNNNNWCYILINFYNYR